MDAIANNFEPITFKTILTQEITQIICPFLFSITNSKAVVLSSLVTNFVNAVYIFHLNLSFFTTPGKFFFSFSIFVTLVLN